MSASVVTLENVTFRYAAGDAPVIEDASLQIAQGDFLGVIGPNGGGKTTLLRIILGLARPQSGAVRVFGVAPRRARARIGYVPQRAALNQRVPATVLDVVLTGRLARSPWGFRYTAAHRDAAHDALALVGCEELGRRPIADLSGGQRQRVLIARARAANSELLLLDEPSSGIDEQAQQSLTALLRDIATRIPVVIVSHDVGFVAAHVKRVACVNRRVTMHDARAVSESAIADLYEHPVSAVAHTHDCPVPEPHTPHAPHDRGPRQ